MSLEDAEQDETGPKITINVDPCRWCGRGQSLSNLCTCNEATDHGHPGIPPAAAAMLIEAHRRGQKA